MAQTAAPSASGDLAWLVGAWDGTMDCAAGAIGLHLDAAAGLHGTVTVKSTVYATYALPKLAFGTLNMVAGTGAAADGPGAVTITPGAWKPAASGWSAFTLTGTAPAAGASAFSGEVSGSGSPDCSDFSLQRAAAAGPSCAAQSMIQFLEGGAWQHVYIDTEDHPTVGYGYNLDTPGARAELAKYQADYDAVLAGTAVLTPDQMTSIFNDSYTAALASAQRFYPDFAQLAPARQDALIDLAYGLPSGISDWNGLLSALNQGDFTQAGLEFYLSKRHTQIPTRTAADASMMITGQVPTQLCNAKVTPTTPESCPSDAAAASPPTGWSAVGPVTVTQGGDSGAFCITSATTYWAGIYLAAPGANYTVTVSGALENPVYGWGVAARATVSGNGTSVTGHAIQYDPGVGGYRDNDYPGDSGPAIGAATDNEWHTLSITVDGSHYTESVDGRQIAAGTLPQAAEAAGGVFIRIWNGAAVELTTPVITKLG
ncbi:hypothetical protein KDL01_28535 [Actinospica durhamensis]|uniref:Uncharacterized protein n=1 Tax=Actinospica durhamensis TaxID=1508375 RepID=A0A941EZQ0_9ACTN|nr:hypothetical protein [Actinospica durhamensis]MBR7837259.1 hypothetical protein [Actinospica durhamensis]